MKYLSALALMLFIGCGDEQEDECMVDEDCPEGQECVISHDHEGDDHSHGGVCEPVDTAQ